MTAEEKLEKIRVLVEGYPSDSTFAVSGAKEVFRRILNAHEKPKAPGDELVREVCRIATELSHAASGAVPMTVVESRRIFDLVDQLRNAAGNYGSRRANEPTDEHLRTADVPDPKKIARFLLDTLTGGALSSLIAQVRDELLGPGYFDGLRGESMRRRGVFDNLRANLRALGEDLL